MLTPKPARGHRTWTHGPSPLFPPKRVCVPTGMSVCVCARVSEFVQVSASVDVRVCFYCTCLHRYVLCMVFIWTCSVCKYLWVLIYEHSVPMFV